MPSDHFLLMGWFGLDIQSQNIGEATALNYGSNTAVTPLSPVPNGFSSQSFPFGINGSYRPTDKLTINGGVAYYTNFIDQGVAFGASGDHTFTPYGLLQNQWGYTSRASVFTLGSKYEITPKLCLTTQAEFVKGIESAEQTAGDPRFPATTAVLAGVPQYLRQDVTSTRFSAGIDYQLTPHLATYFRYVLYIYEDSADQEQIATSLCPVTGLPLSGTSNMFLGGMTRDSSRGLPSLCWRRRQHDLRLRGLQLVADSADLLEQRAGQLGGVVDVVDVVALADELQVGLDAVEFLGDRRRALFGKLGRRQRLACAEGRGFDAGDGAPQRFVVRPQPFHFRRWVAHRTDAGGRLPQHRAGGRDLLVAVARRATHTGHHHAAGVGGNRLAVHSLEHLDLLLVVIGMAAGAIRGGVHEPLLVERVLDAEVAVQAVDGMLGDVFVVHELVVADLRQVALAVVADEAALAGHVAVAADQVGVAALAVDALLEGQFVREFHAAAQVELLLGNLVAVRAGAEPLVERLVLEVAEEAGRGGHGHVLALHDLAVATRAAEGLAAAALAQVRRVVEGNALETRPGRRASASRGSRSGGNWRRGSRPRAAGPALAVTYFSNCTRPSILPRTLPPRPGGKWHSMQVTSLWLDSCHDL